MRCRREFRASKVRNRPDAASGDWRRAARHTALGGLLAGRTSFLWRPASGDESVGEGEARAWEGLVETTPDV